MNLNSVRFMSLVLILGGILTGCASQEISITGAWARPGLQDGNTAVYFRIDNLTGETDVLLSAKADIAAAVELHRSMLVSLEQAVEMEGGISMGSGSMEGDEDQMGEEMVMVMQQQEKVPVPDGETVVFEPGGLHVMMIGLMDDLGEGETFPLTLVFQNFGEITLDVPVGMP